MISLLKWFILFVDAMKTGLMIYHDKAISAQPKVLVSNLFPPTTLSLQRGVSSSDMDTQKFIDIINKVLVHFEEYVNSLNSLNASSSHLPQDSSNTFKASSSEATETPVKGKEEMYVASMRSLQYVEMDNFESFHYQNYSNFYSKTRVRRLAQDHSDLSCNGESLLSWSSSVWVRSWGSRMDCMRVMISGPDGTPYCNGLFIFDVYFPDT